MTLTLKQVAERLGYAEGYVRALIRNGKLKSTKRPVVPGSLTLRHEIEEKDLEEFLQEPHTRSRREDRRHKFIFYGTVEEYQQVVDITRDAGLTEVADTMLPANTIKAIGFIYSPDGHASGRFINRK